MATDIEDLGKAAKGLGFPSFKFLTARPTCPFNSFNSSSKTSKIPYFLIF